MIPFIFPYVTSQGVQYDNEWKRQNNRIRMIKIMLDALSIYNFRDSSEAFQLKFRVGTGSVRIEFSYHE